MPILSLDPTHMRAYIRGIARRNNMKYVLMVYLLTGYAPGPVFHDFASKTACEAAAKTISAVHTKDTKVVMCLPAG
jgi:hypothetical protein